MTETLDILRIEIESAAGVETYDPNTLLIHAIDHPEQVISLTPMPDQVSDVSNDAAVLYRTDDLEIKLSPKELLRFIYHNLTAEEFFKLRDKYGDFYEIHDDFYEPNKGYAFQPVEIG